MIKNEVEVELYILNYRAEYNQLWGRSKTILNCSAGYDQEWGRSRTIYWTVVQDMIKNEVGVELYIELNTEQD